MPHLDWNFPTLQRIPPFSGLPVPSRRAAILIWGKAAHATLEAIERAASTSMISPVLVISPEPLPKKWQRLPQIRWVRGEHPLPGKGSFEAGRAILEFFDELRRQDVSRLEIYLSGGASSLAWLPRGGFSEAELWEELKALYERPLTIAQLNARRSKLCGLKVGGAARWLRILAPEVKARVWLISDVLPSGPSVVGSGPFWDGKIAHTVLADNASWVRALRREARAREVPVISSRVGWISPWRNWAERIVADTCGALERGRHGLLIYGGEPLVDLRGEHRGRGGRQTHLAAALLLELGIEIAQGQVEIVCMSSDGVDGNSRSAGAWLTSKVADRALRNPEALRKALVRKDSATVLGRWGALLKSAPTGTNVQDAVVVWVR